MGKGQQYWGNAGDATNSYIVTPQRSRQLYMKAYFQTLVSRMNGMKNGRINQMSQAIIEPHGGGKTTIDVGNESPIWEVNIPDGNEYRMTMLEDESGLPGSYGDAPPIAGPNQSYRHMVAWCNQIDSKITGLPGRCSLKQVKAILNNPKADVMMNKLRWAAEEVDSEFARAIVMGGSRNLLASKTIGGLNIALYNCTAGQTKSCYNFYTVDSGLVTQNVTRATYEAAIGTALGNVTDTANDGFDYDETQKISNMVKNLRLKPCTFGGRKYRAVVGLDPDLMFRLVDPAGTYTGLVKYAKERGERNEAVYHMDPIEVDNILYFPWEYLKALRPSVVGGVPVYGSNLETDFRSYTNTQKICLGVVMGAGAVVRGVDMELKVRGREDWTGKGVEYFCSWDDGFVRREEFTKDSRTELENTSSIVLAYYDPGVGVAFAG